MGGTEQCYIFWKFHFWLLQRHMALSNQHKRVPKASKLDVFVQSSGWCSTWKSSLWTLFFPQMWTNTYVGWSWFVLLFKWAKSFKVRLKLVFCFCFWFYFLVFWVRRSDDTSWQLLRADPLRNFVQESLKPSFGSKKWIDQLFDLQTFVITLPIQTDLLLEFRSFNWWQQEQLCFLEQKSEEKQLRRMTSLTAWLAGTLSGKLDLNDCCRYLMNCFLSLLQVPARLRYAEQLWQLGDEDQLERHEKTVIL